MACLAFAAVVALSGARAKLVLKSNGKDIGLVETSQRLTADGGRIVELRLTLAGEKRSVTVHTTSTFNVKGEPVRKVQETLNSNHDQRVVIATFDAAGANVVINDGSARKTRQVPVEAAAPRAEAAGFWFLRDHPAVGTKVRQYAFNLDSLAWDFTETSYTGDAPVTVGGKKTIAHVVKIVVGERITTSYLDDKGEPLRVETGNIVMERKE